MKKIWLKTAVPEDFEEAEIGDWIEGVGMVTTHFEKDFIRRWGQLLSRDRIRIGIIQKHDFDSREGNISQNAGQLYFKKREKERELEEIRNGVVPNTHVKKLAGAGEICEDCREQFGHSDNCKGCPYIPLPA